MLDFLTSLKYYSRPEIQQILAESASSRELGVRYLSDSGGYFGKRPDVLYNAADILEFAKNRASSFHISEEHWSNPLSLSPSLSKKELQELRIAWDLIIDIDCPHWELSKRIAYAIIQTFIDHQITCMSCKFSGNKGFHIGIPAAAFPNQVGNMSTSSLFPDKVKQIMEYIIYHTEKNHSHDVLAGFTVKDLSEKLGEPEQTLVKKVCSFCETKIPSNAKSKLTQYHYLCTTCGKQITLDTVHEFINCKGCNSIIRPMENPTAHVCAFCKKPLRISSRIDLRHVLKLDSVLISSRHLYRMPYSLHEKSGLASIVVPISKILEFQREDANPSTLKKVFPFMPYDGIKGSDKYVSDFLLKALDFSWSQKQEKQTLTNQLSDTNQVKEAKIAFEDQERIPEECFPPAIVQIFQGLKDGKKRALFVLVNFLTSVGWSYEEIEARLNAWNQTNFEPLQERLIKSQIAYHKQQNKRVLPPNYSQGSYYADLGVGTDIELRGNMKNPVFFAQRLFKEYKKTQKSKKRNSSTSVQKLPILTESSLSGSSNKEHSKKTTDDSKQIAQKVLEQKNHASLAPSESSSDDITDLDDN